MIGSEYILNSTQLEDAIKSFVHHFCAEKHEIHEQPVVVEADEHQEEKIKQIGIPEKGRPVNEVVSEMMNEVYRYRGDANHPRFFSFVPGPASSVSWLGDIMTSAYNIHAGGSKLAPMVNCIEQEVLQWLAKQVGFTENPGGVFVSGGSMANITALTAARDNKLTDINLHLGTAYISDQTHSSVAKGLRIIGITDNRIRRIPTNSRFQMDLEKLEEAIEQDQASGYIPFVVIGTAGTTNTGSIDPLTEISALCKKYNMWFHIDGAYGASVLLSPKYRSLLKGTELADSISWDAHKWLFQTYGCAMVLVKDIRNLFHSFHVNPEYLKDLENDINNVNTWDIGMELTRPARGLKLWLTLQVLGSDLIGSAIEHGFQLAVWAEEALKEKQDWEIISPAQMAMINFRYAPNDLTKEEQDLLNEKISQKILASGYAAIFTTVLNGKTVLRICAIHPEATQEDMQHTIDLLDQYGQELYEEMKQA
ncbi:MAG: aminotransferase class I/II-fold pyridoxal phosphate-dependent enzyme [[Ruminococcus] gnavus]|nr:aminotransferase class I/II-fold pyridoxal phosphate-dependent enzyme [Mediterraneibacter gnavus]